MFYYIIFLRVLSIVDTCVRHDVGALGLFKFAVEHVQIYTKISNWLYII